MKDILSGVMVSKWLLPCLVAFGGLLVVIGVFRGIKESSQVQVEYLSSESDKSSVVVDVEGSVVNPGVYELSSTSRVKDALVSAGGLSQDADRERVVKTFNMAQSLKDGQKIYVPSLTEKDTGAGYPEVGNSDFLININTAGVMELDTLEGIGESRAKAIIEGRPYGSVDELATRKVIPLSVLEKIRANLSF